MHRNPLQKLLSTSYKRLGQTIGKYPLYFLIIPLLFAIVMSSFVYSINFLRNPFYLFSPLNGQWSKDKDYIQRTFPMNFDDYDTSRDVIASNYIVIHLIPKDRLTLLRENVFKEVAQVNDIVESWKINYRNKTWTYAKLCAKNYGKCYKNDGLIFGKNLKKFHEGNYNAEYPVTINFKSFQVIPWFLNLGGVTVDENNYIKDVLAFRLFYTLSIKDEYLEVIKVWENELIDHINNIKFHEVEVQFLGINTFDKEMRKFTTSNLPLLALSFATTILFAILTCMTNNWVRSKPWLGVSSCISASISVSTTFGFLSILQFNTADINVVLPFLILGMGIDDSFVLISAWRRSNLGEKVEVRMGESYSEAAVSITITSLTSCVSFCIGIVTNLPIIRIFCIYASVAVFFTYIYQITFFGACMALSGYREAKNVHSFLCYKQVKRKQDTSETKAGKDSILKFFGDKIGELLMKTSMKTIIIITYFVILAISIWGLYQLKEGVSVKRVVPSNSELQDIFKVHYRYFSKYSHRVHIVITRPLNYADPGVKQDLKELLDTFINNRYISSNATESWFDIYEILAAHPIGKSYLDNFNLSVEQDYIDGLEKVFLRFPLTKQYKKDIAFNANHTKIISSRFFVMADEIQSGSDERQFLLDMKNIAKNSKIPIIVYATAFSFFEQMVETKSLTVQTICIAAVSMMIIFFLIIPNPLCCFCVTIVIVTVQVETVGLLIYWDINLDLFSLIVLIMSVGFSVNYPSHITYAYITTKTDDKAERLKNALYAVGMPIVQGSLSTILGVIILCHNPSYMILVFVKITFLIILITGFHSLLFLPVILNTFDGFFSRLFNKKKISITSVKPDSYYYNNNKGKA